MARYQDLERYFSILSATGWNWREIYIIADGTSRMDSRLSRVSPSPVFALFFLGVVLLLVVATSFGIGAIRYEFSYGGTVENTETVRWVFEYEDLTPEDRALVQRAIDGERFVFGSDGRLPGPGRGEIAIRHQEEWHLFHRRMYFEPESPFGIASIASALTGVACIGESIRRKRRA